MKAMRLLFVAFVVLGLGGCFFFNGDTTTATLEIVNTSGQTIYYIYISPDASSTWGSDQLGSSNYINNNTSFIFTGINPGTYDLEAREFGNVLVIKSTWPGPGIDFAAGEKVVWIVD